MGPQRTLHELAKDPKRAVCGPYRAVGWLRRAMQSVVALLRFCALRALWLFYDASLQPARFLNQKISDLQNLSTCRISFRGSWPGPNRRTEPTLQRPFAFECHPFEDHLAPGGRPPLRVPGPGRWGRAPGRLRKPLTWLKGPWPTLRRIPDPVPRAQVSLGLDVLTSDALALNIRLCTSASFRHRTCACEHLRFRAFALLSVWLPARADTCSQDLSR